MHDKSWLKVIGSVLLAVAVTAALFALTAIALNRDRWEHIGMHFSIGAGFAVLLVASRMVWPSPRQGAERWLRRALEFGLVAIIIGSVMEIIGAFGYALNDGDMKSDRTLAAVHDIGPVIVPLAMLAALVGLIGTFVMQIWFKVRGLRSAT